MSFAVAAPEMLTDAAKDLATIGSTLNVARMTAATPTLALMPAAGDEVSASIAHLFSRYAQGYQALAGKAAAFHEQFVQHMNASAGSYVSADAGNALALRALNACAGSCASANDILGSLLNSLTGFWNEFTTMLHGIAVALLYYTVILSFAVLFSLFVPGYFTDYFITFA